MSSAFYFIYTLSLYVLAIIYFKIARKYSIVDLPNHRTMHSGATIRGGGIIIFVGVVLVSLLLPDPGYLFTGGLALIGIVGFVDDIVDLSSKVRFPLQAISIVMILAEINLLDANVWILLLIIIIATGILNAYNFMDGINGITGGYSLLFMLSLIYVNSNVLEFSNNSFLIFVIITLLVFNFFNFRWKAVCFAGDVGSLSIAFIIIYLLLKLIIESQQLIFILFLAVYGIDTIFTIIQRLALRENIFEAHRMHLYQVLVSRLKVPHLRITLLYIFIQAVINFVVIKAISLRLREQVIYMGLMLILLSLIYIGVKRKLLRKVS